MIAGLEGFVVELRRRGLAVSPAEWLEAVRAAVEVTLVDRERFRLALRASLVKRKDDRALFDETFDRFFATPAGDRDRGQHKKRRSAEGAAARGRGHTKTGQAALATRIEDLERGRRSRHGRLRRVIRAPEARTPAGKHEPGRRDLSRRLAVEEEKEIAAEIPRLVQRIRLSRGRRLARHPRGKLYPRRLFRESLAWDGVPFVLPRRRRRPRRARVVLLVDVSWSVARAAGLFLALAGEWVARSPRTRVIAFVDRPRESTREVGAWLAKRSMPPGKPHPSRKGGRAGARPGAGIVRGNVSFADLVLSLDALDPSRPSDYGRSFDRLLRSRERPGGRHTVLVVLGDGRTNRLDPQAWAFEEIASRCGAVLWLVPEPVELWGTGDSALDDYLPHVDVAVEARDLAGLARGVGEIVRRLGT